MSFRSAFFKIVTGRPPPEVRCLSLVETTRDPWLQCKFERDHDGECRFPLPPGYSLSGRVRTPDGEMREIES